MRPHILVVDDDEKITSLLRRSLAFEGYEVATAKNGLEGLKQMLSSDPNLLILDVMMPQVDGWEVCRRVREGGSTVPILMLTAKDDIQDRVRGLDLGADDYLVKPFALEELLARVRALLRRKPDKLEESSSRLQFEDLTLDLDSREAIRSGRRIDLTAKEFDLLQLLMQNPRRVLTRDAIMDKIWGYRLQRRVERARGLHRHAAQKTEDGTGKSSSKRFAARGTCSGAKGADERCPYD